MTIAKHKHGWSISHGGKILATINSFETAWREAWILAEAFAIPGPVVDQR